MYSANGINWTSAAAAEANPWNSVTFGDDTFVAIANDGNNRVMYSPDGINWTATRATEANSWWALTYGDGKFVSVSYDSFNGGPDRVMYSTNGMGTFGDLTFPASADMAMLEAGDVVAQAVNFTEPLESSSTVTNNYSPLLTSSNGFNPVA